MNWYAYQKPSVGKAKQSKTKTSGQCREERKALSHGALSESLTVPISKGLVEGAIWGYLPLLHLDIIASLEEEQVTAPRDVLQVSNDMPFNLVSCSWALTNTVIRQISTLMKALVGQRTVFKMIKSWVSQRVCMSSPEVKLVSMKIGSNVTRFHWCEATFHKCSSDPLIENFSDIRA